MDDVVIPIGISYRFSLSGSYRIQGALSEPHRDPSDRCSLASNFATCIRHFATFQFPFSSVSPLFQLHLHMMHGGCQKHGRMAIKMNPRQMILDLLWYLRFDADSAPKVDDPADTDGGDQYPPEGGWTDEWSGWC